ncbi:MAG TPA: hypothetical protein VGR07_14125 [Thermoanaerobaculia bacterium]|jgi:hypothetical protein|nr:hypothetical protein [Thermoanaerobaculia bacterium]
MPHTTVRRISVALVIAAVLALPVRPAAAASPGKPTSEPASRLLEQAWLWVADLLGAPTGAAESRGRTAGHPGLTALHGDLGGFIDPDGRNTLNTAPRTFALPYP